MSKSGPKKDMRFDLDGCEIAGGQKLDIRVLLPDSSEAKKREARKPLYLTRYE